MKVPFPSSGWPNLVSTTFLPSTTTQKPHPPQKKRSLTNNPRENLEIYNKLNSFVFWVSRGVSWFETDVSELSIGPIFKGLAVQYFFLNSLTLEDGTDRQSLNVDIKTIYTVVTTQKTEEFISAAAEA